MSGMETINFPDFRESGSTRLEQCHAVMLRMLKIIDALCREEGIEYFLVGGSLIGAVRHQGFIPWDDDLDIGMTRHHYDNFLKYVVPRLPRDLFFQDYETDRGYPKCHCVDGKIRDNFSSMGGRFAVAHPACHDGIVLDIFVFHRAYIPFKPFIIAFNIIISRLLADRTRKQFLKWLGDKNFRGTVYAHNFLRYFSSFQHGNNYLREDEIWPLKVLPFQEVEAMVPNGYHTYLTRQFGNYMQPPPVEKRQGHHSATLPDPFTPCEHPMALQWPTQDHAGTDK